jgi:hypothetical protein
VEAAQDARLDLILLNLLDEIHDPSPDLDISDLHECFSQSLTFSR